MEAPGMRVVRPTNEDGTNNPNHLIIWLDRYIGRPDECMLLKRSFFMTTDPTTGYASELNEKDIDHSIRLDQAVPICLDGIQFMLRAFENVDKCFQAVKNNLDKRIFFITTGSKGRMIVPILLANFATTFIPDHKIYIFCGNMNMIQIGGAAEPAHEWAMDYVDNVLMLNHQDDLLARLILDIANYFFMEAERLDKGEQLESSCRHYYWSKQMYQRYETMEKKKLMTTKMNVIDQRVNAIEQRLNQQSNSASDCMSKQST